MKNNTFGNIFWIYNPSILIDVNDLTILPTPQMNLITKLNAISRLVIILSLIGFVITRSFKFILMGIITLIAIGIIYFLQSKNNQEGFEEGKYRVSSENSVGDPETTPLKDVVTTDFYQSNKKNPFGNVLLTDIMDTPNRLAAPPLMDVDVAFDTTKNVKKMVQSLNPEIKNTNHQLFGDLYENFELDNSNRVFYSTANTRVTQDQGAYARFLYGSMPSGKQGDPFQLLADSFRYILQ